MSKKPGKTASRAASRAGQRKSSDTAAKRPTASSEGDTAERIARALESIASHLSAASPKSSAADSLGSADAFVWHPDGRLAPVPRVSRVDIDLLKGIDRMRDILIENTERFADGLPANNALLWGARGMGKSSLVKAAHASINANRKPADRLKLIEIHREDIESLPALMDLVRSSHFHFIVFCDDLSFDGNDASYKSLKAVLEGGIEGRPGQRDPVRDLQPPASSGARDDRERTLDRDQSRRGGRGKSVAVGPLRIVARLSPLQPGRIPRDGQGLLRPFRHQARGRTNLNARRWNGRPRAVHAPDGSPGSSRRNWRGGWA